MAGYIIGIDQSTQGTKALLVDSQGRVVMRRDTPHRQIINEQGYVSHDLKEIYGNTIKVVEMLLRDSKIDPAEIKGVGISNQRETTAAWDRESKEPLAKAIVWQCSRAKEVCERDKIREQAEEICQRTGLRLSPYFPAAKMRWLLEQEEEVQKSARRGTLCLGTIDSWLLFRLTGGTVFCTDYSNASRTQLFNIFDLCWDEEICGLFGIKQEWLPKVCDSNSCFGETTFEGLLPNPVPINGILGDSHGALFGQGCLQRGMIKATYGTGSSVMMNIGGKPIHSKNGVVTSLAWSVDGVPSYVLEGNINYTGAVITWMKDDLELIHSPGETEALAESANKDDGVYMVPAFTGLGAPYWESRASAGIVGMTRTTKRPEIVRAGLESIAYQITDVILAMKEDSKIPIQKLRVDGGPTRNRYLMQFQSDMLGIPVQVPEAEELSGLGASYMAGLSLGVMTDDVFDNMSRMTYRTVMEEEQRKKKYTGWMQAVKQMIPHEASEEK